MKKKKESMNSFIKRRNKETGKVVIPETKVSPPDSGGSHKTKARQFHVGVVKPKTAKKWEAREKRKKRKSLSEVFS